ncbi:sulfatase family protein [Actinomadura alba]|uniref:Sulfatase n=1 Tax=Actinomadura alba TaxID=406431 RepID=A0ABR7LVZ5_9ACTN|nr:sulfatase [Actinomadura alba]MBC6468640.1 sulfatase [Actinomadura alba]
MRDEHEGQVSGESEVSRRRFLAGSAAAVAATATLSALPGVAGSASAVARPTGTRPNVLLIVTDDQPKDTDWATQRIRNWLVGNGVEFTNGHVTTPLCAPSRSSIFSGRYAHNHGVLSNGHSYNLDQNTTVQRYLKEAGYRNGFFGKYLNSWNVADTPPHFEDFALLGPVVYNDGQYNRNGTVQKIPGYSTHVIRDLALDFIQKGTSDTRPWFLVVTPKAPHGPNTPEPKYANTAVPAWNGRPSVFETDKSDKPAYVQDAKATLADGQRIRQDQFRTLLSVDDAVQSIHNKLQATGQLDNTLVIYIGDNGFAWADHGRTAKSVPYRPSIEVPFYLSWPAAGLGAGTTDNRLVANIDIAPTILNAVGIKPDTPQDGRSLLTPHRRWHLLTEWWKQGNGTAGPTTWASYISTREQYTEYYDLRADRQGALAGTGAVLFREYYDLVNDPYQLTNKLYQATQRDERKLGIPALAARLAADRESRGHL